MTDQAVLVRSAAHLLRAERANDEGVGGSGMSGSGLGPISPDPSPTPIMPIDKLVLLIVIELNLGRDEYEDISSVIVLSLQNVSQTFTNSTIIVDIDAEESNDTVTVILVHFESSSGEVDNPATMALFQFLSAEANLILFPQLEQYVSPLVKHSDIVPRFKISKTRIVSLPSLYKGSSHNLNSRMPNVAIYLVTLFFSLSLFLSLSHTHINTLTCSTITTCVLKIISVSTRLDEPSSPPTVSVNEVLTIWQWILIFVGVGILMTAFPLACQVVSCTHNYILILAIILQELYT